MASIVLFIASLIALSHVSQGQRYLMVPDSLGEGGCGGPAEEGTEHTITCSTLDGESDMGVDFIYRIPNNDEWYTLASCYENGYKCGGTTFNSAYFEAFFYSGNEDYSIYNYGPFMDTANLTIYNVSRSEPFDMQVEFRCYWYVGYDTYLCNPLEIYARAQNPECENPTYDSGTDTVHITCTTERIYPQAKCQLYLKNSGGVDFQPMNPPVTYQHTALAEDPVYYLSQCFFIISGQDLDENTLYDFYVTIYPNVTGGERFGEDTEPKNFDLQNLSSFSAATTTTTNISTQAPQTTSTTSTQAPGTATATTITSTTTTTTAQTPSSTTTTTTPDPQTTTTTTTQTLSPTTTTTTPVPETITTTAAQSPSPTTTTPTPVQETTITTTEDGENSVTTTTTEVTTNESPRHALPVNLLSFVAITISILSQALM